MKYFVGDLVLLPYQGESELRRQIAERLGISVSSFSFEWLKRRATYVDGKLKVIYECSIDTLAFIKNTQIPFFEELAAFSLPKFNGKGRIAVVGGGFSGTFCAYLLAKSGAEVVLFEQGDKWNERKHICQVSCSGLNFSESTNFSYGYGGTYSMLGGYYEQGITTGLSKFVIDTLIELGLPSSIKKEGFLPLSDLDFQIFFSNAYNYIAKHRGTILFNSKVTSVTRFLGWPRSINFVSNGEKRSIKVSHVVVATGLSSQSIDELEGFKIPLRNSTPSLGVFIEANGRDFEAALYGRGATGRISPLFEVKEFKDSNGRIGQICSGYSNGSLINLSSIENQVNLGIKQNVWSGSGNAVSYVSVQLSEEEVKKLSDNSNFGFCQKILSCGAHRKSPYAIPAETLGDFMSKKDPMLFSSIHSSYGGDIFLANLHKFMPASISQSLLTGFYELGRLQPIFANSRCLVSGFSTMESSLKLPSPTGNGYRGIYPLLPRKGDGRNCLKLALNALETCIALLNDN